jgi:hypothetical protein
MVLVNERSLGLLDCDNYADWDDARQPMHYCRVLFLNGRTIRFLAIL